MKTTQNRFTNRCYGRYLSHFPRAPLPPIQRHNDRIPWPHLFKLPVFFCYSLMVTGKQKSPFVNRFIVLALVRCCMVVGQETASVKTEVHESNFILILAAIRQIKFKTLICPKCIAILPSAYNCIQ